MVYFKPGTVQGHMGLSQLSDRFDLSKNPVIHFCSSSSINPSTVLPIAYADVQEVLSSILGPREIHNTCDP
jgi:hypothetical protein